MRYLPSNRLPHGSMRRDFLEGPTSKGNAVHIFMVRCRAALSSHTTCSHSKATSSPSFSQRSKIRRETSVGEPPGYWPMGAQSCPPWVPISGVYATAPGR